MDVEIKMPKTALIDWKKALVYVVPAVLIAGLLVAKVGTRKGRLEEEYVKATQAFAKWDHLLDSDDEGLASLQKVMKKHPELEAHYDGTIGQNLLSTYSAKEATPYIERTLKRTGDSLYAEYARGSLSITEGKYEEALTHAISLKNSVAGLKDHEILYAFNLMRIAILSRQLGERQTEQEALSEVKEGINKGRTGFQQLQSHLTVQETSLLDYIQSREGG